MKVEEAIRILDPETSREALLKCEDLVERIEVVNEACRVACAAIRTQKTTAILDGIELGMCNACEANRFFGNMFCSRCGRPLTEYAWAELERRINGGTTD